jgi:hypothetical protein
MSFITEGRLSDSPYVECVWHGQAEADAYSLMCPADGRLNLRFTTLQGRVQVSVEGPMTRAVPKTHVEGIDWFVIKFKLGAFMPCVLAKNLLDGEAVLPEGAHKSFWLNGSVWQLPDYENADTFADWLIRADVLLWDPVVRAALYDQPPAIPARTMRHRFLHVTGLPQGTLRQIERAREAMTLLQKGFSILDVVDEMGYADQSHLTRSLKRFMGYTPAQIAGWRVSG